MFQNESPSAIAFELSLISSTAPHVRLINVSRTCICNCVSKYPTRKVTFFTTFTPITFHFFLLFIIYPLKVWPFLHFRLLSWFCITVIFKICELFHFYLKPNPLFGFCTKKAMWIVRGLWVKGKMGNLVKDISFCNLSLLIERIAKVKFFFYLL